MVFGNRDQSIENRSKGSLLPVTMLLEFLDRSHIGRIPIFQIPRLLDVAGDGPGDLFKERDATIFFPVGAEETVIEGQAKFCEDVAMAKLKVSEKLSPMPILDEEIFNDFLLLAMVHIPRHLARLLGHVGQFVGDQLLPVCAGWIILPLVEENVVSIGEGAGADTLVHLRRRCVRMDPDLGEWLPEGAFHLRAQQSGQGVPAAQRGIQLAFHPGREHHGRPAERADRRTWTGRGRRKRPGGARLDFPHREVRHGIGLLLQRVIDFRRFQFCLHLDSGREGRNDGPVGQSTLGQFAGMLPENGLLGILYALFHLAGRLSGGHAPSINYFISNLILVL